MEVLLYFYESTFIYSRMAALLDNLGFLAGGSRLRRIYEKLQLSGDKVYKDAGLDFKSSWFPVYSVLARHSAPMTIMEITDQIAFSHITVKNIIQELEKKGLIYIVPNPGDRRSKLVSLSDGGKSLLLKLEPLWHSFSIAIQEVFETGHPDMTGILSRIDLALEQKPLEARVIIPTSRQYTVRNASPGEFKTIGALMIKAYANLEGFPNAAEQPGYYQMLANVGELTKKPKTELLVAVSSAGKIAGAVVFFGDMRYYGSGGSATTEHNACGFRLLAVAPSARGKGIGKLLTKACILKGERLKRRQVIIHTTKAMQLAWKMYERLGFRRSEDLDFMQGTLAVYGFRLLL
jgi:DNA-binding MarR family transcriptional regulator/ribosomal protein S18 acetylase RimI-like enzyme